MDTPLLSCNQSRHGPRYIPMLPPQSELRFCPSSPVLPSVMSFTQVLAFWLRCEYQQTNVFLQAHTDLAQPANCKTITIQNPLFPRTSNSCSMGNRNNVLPSHHIERSLHEQRTEPLRYCSKRAIRQGPTRTNFHFIGQAYCETI